MKYPIGIHSFDRIRNEGYVYVDKTALIYQLVTAGKIYFLETNNRPVLFPRRVQWRCRGTVIDDLPERLSDNQRLQSSVEHLSVGLPE